ncbi:MAG: MBL fold metallo-hydrolase [Anaeroplasmataceae bacterium]
MVEKYISGPFFTNTYVLSKGNDAIIIDPTMNFDKYASLIKEKYNVKAVLITHAHIDHIDGIIHFKELPIYISSADYKYIKDDDYTLYSFFKNSKIFDLTDFNFVLVNDGDTINLLDEKIEVMLTPGHTLGGVCYKYKNIVFTGDTLFKGSIGRTDFPGGNEREILKSIKRIIETYPDNTKLYPGHDEETTIRDERKNNVYYSEALNRF